jgi:deoxyribodipyrimidine photo-lyase
MTAFRRTHWNFSLQRAVEWATELKQPLLVFEALRCDYCWASDRLHAFVIEGMAANARHLAARRVAYYPYIERRKGEGKGLLARLSRDASVVVGDDFPSFFLPRMVSAAAAQIPVRFELVDSNGLLPLRAADKVFARAVDFRRFLQKRLPRFLMERPAPDPIARLPADVENSADLHGALAPRLRRWTPLSAEELSRPRDWLAGLPIDHSVPPVDTMGGAPAAANALDAFVSQRLERYEESRNRPEEQVTSGLSPYLHFGHISPHQIFARVAENYGWTPSRLSSKPNGRSRGWWGLPPAAEAFLDQLVTWRELGYNMCWQREDHDRYESLPDWARATLDKHAADPRPYVYTAAELESAATHDPLWNAAQRQLVRTGGIHNYLRMLWGKKILEWSPSAEQALEVMIHLNNKYALDGRNPNSYTGIFWVLGRYDRPWAPERPVLGRIRYMSSDNTARKMRVSRYLEVFGR